MSLQCKECSRMLQKYLSEVEKAQEVCRSEFSCCCCFYLFYCCLVVDTLGGFQKYLAVTLVCIILVMTFNINLCAYWPTLRCLHKCLDYFFFYSKLTQAHRFVFQKKIIISMTQTGIRSICKCYKDDSKPELASLSPSGQQPLVSVKRNNRNCANICNSLELREQKL